MPVFGQALATLHMMAIDRKKGSRAYEQFMNQGKDFMKRGWWLAMFPEGTRTRPVSRHTISQEVLALP